jgi:hypothetical protein
VRVPAVTGSSTVWALSLRDLGARPELGDEVLVGFASGDPGIPYVIGVVATGPSVVELADGNGSSIRLGPSGIEMSAAAEIRLTAPSVKVVTGSAQVDAELAAFSTVVKCSTLVADSVTAASYSPGVGNVM